MPLNYNKWDKLEVSRTDNGTINDHPADDSYTYCSYRTIPISRNIPISTRGA